MAGLMGATPGAKAFDELTEQLQLVRHRNFNDGEPPKEKAIISTDTPDDFRANVLNSLGIGKNVTGAG